jgi:hypothetical protein
MKNGTLTAVALVFSTVESGTRAYRDQSPTCKRIERPYGSARSLKYLYGSSDFAKTLWLSVLRTAELGRTKLPNIDLFSSGFGDLQKLLLRMGPRLCVGLVKEGGSLFEFD